MSPVKKVQERDDKDTKRNGPRDLEKYRMITVERKTGIKILWDLDEKRCYQPEKCYPQPHPQDDGGSVNNSSQLCAGPPWKKEDPDNEEEESSPGI